MTKCFILILCILSHGLSLSADEVQNTQKQVAPAQNNQRQAADMPPVAVRADYVDSIPECFDKKTKKRFAATFTVDEVRNLQKCGDFPMAWYTLDKPIATIEKYHDWQTNRKASCDMRDNCQYLRPHPIEIALGKIAKKINDSIYNDMKNQQSLLQNGLKCTQVLQDLTLGDTNWQDMKVSDFENYYSKKQLANEVVNAPSPKKCFEFAQKFIPEIKKRLTRSRILLAISKRPIQRGFLKSDKNEFTMQLIANFYPNLKKEEFTKPRLLLSDAEFAEAQKLAETMTPEEAQMEYEAILSTSPLILFFDYHVNPKTLHHAFSKMNDQNNVDINQFKKNVSQEIMLLSPYVKSALDNTPEEERGNACLLINEVIKNVVSGSVVIPERLMYLGMYMTFFSGLARQTAGEFISWFTSGMGASMGAQGVWNAADGTSKYMRAISRCSTIVLEKEMNPDLKGLCDIHGTQVLADKAMEETTYKVLGGALTMGAGRVIKHFWEKRKGLPSEKFLKENPQE